MLFAGEAIFGVVDFAQHARHSESLAQSIIGAARQQGEQVLHKTAGRGTLGWLGAGSRGFIQEPIASSAGSLAVSIGEFYERGGRQGRFCGEPERSARMATGFASDGESFLQRLDGVFASAIWNESEQELLLACDGRGDGRLFYAVEDGCLLFSSWLPLLASPSTAIDPEAVSEFLRFLYIAAPRTVYRGIARMESNHYLKLSRGRIELKSLEPPAREVSENHPEQCLNAFQDRFETAIRRRIGPRRVGVLLSGGVDSATLAAGCQRANPGYVEAFTVGFDNSELDETMAARALAHQIGVPHRELRYALPEYAAAFERVIKGMEQPFGDPVELPLALACESVKESVAVICDGTGSDGLFGAPIPRHLRFSLQTAARLPAALRRGIGAAMRRAAVAPVARHASAFDFDDPEELFVTWTGWSRRELAELFGRKIDFHDSGFYRAYRARAGIGAQAVYEAVGEFPPDDSRFDCAALAGTALTLPYHDIDLWNYVRALPEHRRFTEAESKVALQGLFLRYFPRARTANKKHYFNMPLAELMAHSNHALINEYLATGIVKKHGAVDPEKLQPWITRYMAGENGLRFKLWAMVVLHAWLEAHR